MAADGKDAKGEPRLDPSSAPLANRLVQGRDRACCSTGNARRRRSPPSPGRPPEPKTGACRKVDLGRRPTAHHAPRAARQGSPDPRLRPAPAATRRQMSSAIRTRETARRLRLEAAADGVVAAVVEVLAGQKLLRRRRWVCVEGLAGRGLSGRRVRRQQHENQQAATRVMKISSRATGRVPRGPDRTTKTNRASPSQTRSRRIVRLRSGPLPAPWAAKHPQDMSRPRASAMHEGHQEDQHHGRDQQRRRANPPADDQHGAGAQLDPGQHDRHQIDGGKRQGCRRSRCRARRRPVRRSCAGRRRRTARPGTSVPARRARRRSVPQSPLLLDEHAGAPPRIKKTFLMPRPEISLPRCSPLSGSPAVAVDHHPGRAAGGDGPRQLLENVLGDRVQPVVGDVHRSRKVALVELVSRAGIDEERPRREDLRTRRRRGPPRARRAPGTAPGSDTACGRPGAGRPAATALTTSAITAPTATTTASLRTGSARTDCSLVAPGIGLRARYSSLIPQLEPRRSSSSRRSRSRIRSSSMPPLALEAPLEGHVIGVVGASSAPMGRRRSSSGATSRPATR